MSERKKTEMEEYISPLVTLGLSNYRRDHEGNLTKL